MIGNFGSLGSKLDDAIAEEIKKVQTGWGRSPEVKKARALLHGKKKLGEAAAALAAAESKIKDDAKADFEEAKAELETKYAMMKNAPRLKRRRKSNGSKKSCTASMKCCCAR